MKFDTMHITWRGHALCHSAPAMRETVPLSNPSAATCLECLEALPAAEIRAEEELDRERTAREENC